MKGVVFMKAKKIAAISSAIIFGTSTALAGMPTTTLAQEQTVTEETTATTDEKAEVQEKPPLLKLKKSRKLKSRLLLLKLRKNRKLKKPQQLPKLRKNQQVFLLMKKIFLMLLSANM